MVVFYVLKPKTNKSLSDSMEKMAEFHNQINFAFCKASIPGAILMFQAM